MPVAVCSHACCGLRTCRRLLAGRYLLLDQLDARQGELVLGLDLDGSAVVIEGVLVAMHAVVVLAQRQMGSSSAACMDGLEGKGDGLDAFAGAEGRIRSAKQVLGGRRLRLALGRATV